MRRKWCPFFLSMLQVGDDNLVSGALQLPLGGINVFKGVCGGQGRKKDKYQGTRRRRSGTAPTSSTRRMRLP